MFCFVNVHVNSMKNDR